MKSGKYWEKMKQKHLGYQLPYLFLDGVSGSIALSVHYVQDGLGYVRSLTLAKYLHFRLG